MRTSSEAIIIGAGPYGLSAAAHLRARNIETRIFGEAMEFWDKQMPMGMKVRSVRSASHIADPQRRYRVEDYEAAEGVKVPEPAPLEDFVAYGRWFGKQVAPDLDSRRINGVQARDRGFRVTLDDGEEIDTRRVIVATGISKFAKRPKQLDGLPSSMASHAVEHRDLSVFKGRKMVVIGGGQSAIESSALLHENGAEVEVIARQPGIRWLDQKAHWLKSPANPLRALLYPPTDVGPPIFNQIVANPGWFRRLPYPWQVQVAYRSIRPAASGWLVPRTRNVTISTGRSIVSATRVGDRVQLTLDDQTRREVDHVFISTGFQVDVSRYGFLDQSVLRPLRLVDGYPVLGGGMQSSVPGLHFLGAPAAYSYGPVCRFVSGTTFAGAELARGIVRARRGAPSRIEALEPSPEAALAE